MCQVLCYYKSCHRKSQPFRNNVITDVSLPIHAIVKHLRSFFHSKNIKIFMYCWTLTIQMILCEKKWFFVKKHLNLPLNDFIRIFLTSTHVSIFWNTFASIPDFYPHICSVQYFVYYKVLAEHVLLDRISQNSLFFGRKITQG